MDAAFEHRDIRFGLLLDGRSTRQWLRIRREVFVIPVRTDRWRIVARCVRTEAVSRLRGLLIKDKVDAALRTRTRLTKTVGEHAVRSPALSALHSDSLAHEDSGSKKALTDNIVTHQKSPATSCPSISR